MIKHIKKFFSTLGYMLAFGVKGGNDVLQTQDPNHGTIGVIQNEETKGLGAALLKGEINQQVEELRYRDYKVYKESKHYSYIGDGKAIKLKSIQENRDKYVFTQSNSLICEGVSHELNRIGSYGTDRYTFDIVYTDITRFRIESYISYGKFTVSNDLILIDLFFDKTIKNKYDSISYSILKELSKISKFKSSYEIEHNDICSNVQMLNFTTYKSNGEDDFVQYVINNMKYCNCIEYNDYYVLSYQSKDFSKIDLTNKFYSKTMDEKYKAKTPKEIQLNLNDERVGVCSVCGNQMNVYDADITLQEYGKCLCKDCLSKVLKTIDN